MSQLAQQLQYLANESLMNRHLLSTVNAFTVIQSAFWQNFAATLRKNNES
jgi:hypothetical protein